MKKYLFINLIVFLSFFRVNAQQEPGYTMYMFSLLGINPAYAGFASEEGLDVSLLAREQWIRTIGAPSTQIFSLNQPLNKKPVGVGLTVINHSVGVTRDLSVFAQAAYNIKLSSGERKFSRYRRGYILDDKKLSFGLQFGINSYNIDLQQVVTTSGLPTPDPSFSSNVSSTTFNMGFGLAYVSNSFYAGFSIPYLLNTSIGNPNGGADLSLRTRHIYFHAGTTLDFPSRKISFQPGILLRMISGVPLEYDLNGIVYFDRKFGVGLNLRQLNILDFIFKMNVTKKLRLGYSFSTVGNKYRSAVPGSSHEFMIGYTFVKNNKPRFEIKHPRYF